MNTPRNTKELFALYLERGDEPYGEAITQTEHALQCAARARAEGATDAMVVAALFHDVGHLVVEIQNEPGFKMDEDDDDHEAIGARVLAPLFGPSVAGPVALHVTAKRWRCSTDPGYYDRLSEASKMTLKAQGGLLSDEECLRFEEHPGFPDALALRTWDDEGKIEGLDVGSLDNYIEMVTSLASTWSRAHHAR